MDPSLNTRQTNKTRAELGKVVKMIAAHTRSVLRTIRRNKLIISSCIQSSQQISHLSTKFTRISARSLTKYQKQQPEP